MNTGVAFERLRIEMAIKNLTITQMAIKIGFNRETLSRKLSMKSPLSLREAFIIQREYFPNIPIIELFVELYEQKVG